MIGNKDKRPGAVNTVVAEVNELIPEAHPVKHPVAPASDEGICIFIMPFIKG